MTRMAPRDVSVPHVAATIVLMLTAVLFAPTMVWLLETWLAHPYYSHGVLVPPIALWLVWRSRHDLTTDKPDDFGLALIAAGVLVHVIALRWAHYPLSSVGLVTVLAGVSALLGGRRALRASAVPLMLLVTAIPIPYVEQLAPPLAAGVAHAAAGTAESMGVAVERSGAQLSVADGTFVVGAPCSGLRSLVALVTIAVLTAGVTATTASRRMVLPLAAIALAVLGNWVRLTSLIVAVERFGIEPSLQVFHAVSGPLVFAFVAAALVALGHTLVTRDTRSD